MHRRMIMGICAGVILMGACAVVQADPVMAVSFGDDRQDDWFLEQEVEELSTAPNNPLAQLISSWEVTWEGYIPCPTDYENESAGTTVQIAIMNLTDRYFPELYYVGDVSETINGGSHDAAVFETTFTNVDELVADFSPWHQSHAAGLAFRIDAFGLNTPLVSESLTRDGIFEPGEVWEFVIQEYANVLLLPPSALGSVGPTPWGAIAAASPGDQISSGSIITPEPVTLCLLGLGGMVVLRRRR